MNTQNRRKIWKEKLTTTIGRSESKISKLPPIEEHKLEQSEETLQRLGDKSRIKDNGFEGD